MPFGRSGFGTTPFAGTGAGATGGADAIPPSRPTISAVSAGPYALDLSATYVSGWPQTDSDWELDVSGGDFSSPTWQSLGAGATTTESATGLDPGPSQIRCRVKNQWGWSAWSYAVAVRAPDALTGGDFSQTASVDYQQMASGIDPWSDLFDDDLSDWTHFADATGASAVVSGGQLTVTNSSGAARGDDWINGADLTVPQRWVEIEVVGKSTANGVYDHVAVGIAKGSGDRCWALYNRTTGVTFIQTVIGGTVHNDPKATIGALTNFKLGFALVGNSASVWHSTDGGATWTFDGVQNISGYQDFQTASLTGWKAGFAVYSGGNSTWVLDNFKSDAFGGVGLRDVTVVTAQDGTPVMTGDAVYLTATVAGPAGGGYEGVFTLDLVTHELTQTAVHLFDRSSKKQLDVAGHIVTDGAGNFDVSSLVAARRVERPCVPRQLLRRHPLGCTCWAHSRS